MYGLPQSFDVGFFLGRKLVQVSFTVNTIHLTFDQDISITIESSYVRKRDSNDLGSRHVVPERESDLMELLGHDVQSATPSRDGTLALTFDDGQVLVCLDDSKAYESYRIQKGDTATIV